MRLFSWNFPEGLVARVTGPVRFRFFFQPLMAIILGVRDGIRDAKGGEPPYGYELLFLPRKRGAALRQGLQHVLKLIIVGVVLDGIFQYLVLGTVYIGEAAVFGVLIIALPYVTARGLTNRLLRHRYQPQPPPAVVQRES
jgi:hypothetical protein